MPSSQRKRSTRPPDPDSSERRLRSRSVVIKPAPAVRAKRQVSTQEDGKVNAVRKVRIPYVIS
jgi:hypothetical protein